MTHPRLLITLVTLILAGCTAHCNRGPVPPPQPGATGGLSSGGQGYDGGAAGAAQGGSGGMAGGSGGVPQECVSPADACDRAACRLALLDCPERTTPQGSPAAVICHQKAAEGRPWPTLCIIQAPSCEAARSCQ